MTARRLWLIGGVLAVLAVLALGWFLLIGPVLAAVQVADRETADVEANNALQEARVLELAAAFENIDDLRAELAADTAVVPGDLRFSELLRQLAAAEATTGATITGITPGPAVPYVPGEPADAGSGTTSDPPAGTEADDAAPAEGATAPEAATPSGTVPPSGRAGGVAPVDPVDAARVTSGDFLLVPVQLTASGGVEEMLQLVSALHDMERLFLVTAYTAAEGEGAGGTVSGYVYVLLTPPSEPPTPAAG